MDIIKLEDVKGELIKQIKRQSLYPVIGAGFTAGCIARNGKTPEGDELREKMLHQINANGYDTKGIEKKDLKKVSKYYKSLVSREDRTKYLIDNFTEIVLPESKKKFINIEWKYIYTFNIDTAIEENSKFRNVILPNKECDDRNIAILNNCIFKIHGDVDYYCKYPKSECYIFDSREYIQSIKNNTYILNKLKHDFSYNNLMYIGCSLTDELDIMSITIDNEFAPNTKRYYVTSKEPDAFKKIDLENYGITDVVLVDSYNQFYNEMYLIYMESKKIVDDELSYFLNPELNFISNTFGENKEYFYLAKLLYDSKTKKLNIPSYFIDREVIKDNLIPELNKYNMQFICGGRVSGKSYSLVTIVKNIQDRDVYYFDSRYTLSQDSLCKLLLKKNTIICFDTSSISKDQIFFLKENIEIIEKNKINIIICINRSDKDVISSIKKNSMDDRIALYELDNKFKKDECDMINNKLPILSIPNFDMKKSVLDNLLIASEINASPYKECKKKFDIDNKYTMMLFILLAINEKISSIEFIEYGVVREVYDLLHRLSPIIDEDYTSMIERDTLNSSVYKVYANSRYWLLSELGTYASKPDKHKLIIEAYHMIVESLIKNYGVSYKYLEDYIKYDVINEIFFRKTHGNLLLIKKLYDSLDDLLASEPQFYHQKAKCYLWHCDYTTDKNKEISDALRYAKLAKHNLKLHSNVNNDKVLISLAHIDFTIALIYAKINALSDYSDIKVFKESIPILKESLTNPLNREYFLGLMKRNNKKINDINKFYNYVTTNDLSKYCLNNVEKINLEELVNYIFDMK